MTTKQPRHSEAKSKWTEVSDSIAAWAEVIIILASAIIGFSEYFRNNAREIDEKSKQAITFIHEALSKDITDAFASLTTPFDDDGFRQQAEAKSKAGDQEYAGFLRAGVLKDASKKINLVTLVRFYDEMGVCAQRKLCDAEVLRQAFSYDAKWLIENYGAWIRLRSYSHTYPNIKFIADLPPPSSNP